MPCSARTRSDERRQQTAVESLSCAQETPAAPAAASAAMHRWCAVGTVLLGPAEQLFPRGSQHPEATSRRGGGAAPAKPNVRCAGTLTRCFLPTTSSTPPPAQDSSRLDSVDRTTPRGSAAPSTPPARFAQLLRSPWPARRAASWRAPTTWSAVPHHRPQRGLRGSRSATQPLVGGALYVAFVCALMTRSFQAQ
jgi:hypothetical protein